MKNDDELLLRELEFIVEEGIDETARQITENIFQVSNRLNVLRPAVRIRAATDKEGSYLHREVDRLQTYLQELNSQYMQLHNMQLDSASQYSRPTGNIPD